VICAESVSNLEGSRLTGWPGAARAAASESEQPDAPLANFVLSTPSVLETMLLFCASMMRARDTRSVIVILRVLRPLVSRFRYEAPIRDFFCDQILKNAITALHDPYYVDCQKDLASLIGTICQLEDSKPREILLSLPGMGDIDRVDRKLHRLRTASRNDDRLQRSVVLDLLSSVRGVSIYEQGKIERAKPKKSAFQEQYMSVDQPVKIVRGTSPGLVGVADMFGDA
jgi:exportin-5